MKQLTFLSIFAMSLLSFHKVNVSSFRLPASEVVQAEDEKNKDQEICDNEDKIESLSKELQSLEKKKLELEELLDKALAKDDSKEDEDKTSKDEETQSIEDFQSYFASLYMYQMYRNYSQPTISYLNSPLHNSSSSQLISYLNAVQMNQSILDNKFSGTWSPSFTPSGDLVDYQYGPAGVFSNQYIEQAYRPINTLESINNPLGSFQF